MTLTDLIATFDHAYIVNLASRTDRRAETVAEFARHGVAIPNPKVTFFDATRPTQKEDFPTLGTLGNFISQTRVLEHAMEQGHTRILIFEDDVRFLDVSEDAIKRILRDLKSEPWSIASLGYNIPETAPGSAPGLHIWEDGVIGAQMWAIQAPALETFHTYLKRVRHRPLGHPLGGAMHFDAAFYMVRKEFPDISHHLSHPSLAGQRSSRTDIHDLRFYDRVEPFRSVVALLRKLMNRTKR